MSNSSLCVDLLHDSIRSSLIERQSANCFLENAASFSLSNHSLPQSSYELFLTSSGQCLQLLDYQLYLTDLRNRDVSYRLQPNSIDGARSSYYQESGSSLMSTTLLNDENHVIVRFVHFSPSSTGHPFQMISTSPSAPAYHYQEKQHSLRLSSSSLVNHSSPLMIKCSGPCCYSGSFDRFAFNVNNYLYIYDLPTSQLFTSVRVPIRRVTLNDVKFSSENSNLLYTTNGHQFQQWDLRESNRTCSSRLPILCSTIKCLQSKSNCLLTSSFDERTNLIDLRQPTQPLLVYDSSTSSSSSTNPHFTFTIDHGSEHFLAACSQHHIAHVWDLLSGRLLNRFRCPIPERLVHSSSKCAIACVSRVPHLGIYHPEYTRLS